MRKKAEEAQKKAMEMMKNNPQFKEAMKMMENAEQQRKQDSMRIQLENRKKNKDAASKHFGRIFIGVIKWPVITMENSQIGNGVMLKLHITTVKGKEIIEVII